MSLFGNSSNSFLGVDIGTSSIKIVELKKHHGKVALATYGFSDELAADYPDANKLNIKKTSAIIEKIVKKSSISSTNNVIASLPTFTVFSSIINISGKMSDKDLSSSIQWEAKKVIPLPLKDIVLDWQKIQESDDAVEKAKLIEAGKKGKGKQVKTKKEKKASSNKILLIGAPKSLIKSYAYAFKTMDFGLISLETEIFGLVRSLIGNDRSTIMIVQMGASSTNLFIVDKGVPILSRSIDVGGLAITKAISKQLNIDLEKAEQFKYDLASHNEEKGLPKVIIDVIAPVLNEIKYILEVFGSKDTSEIEKVILTGGSAMLYGLPEHLSEALSMNVIIGDPWFRVAYPAELKPVLEQIGPRLSAVIGLAMREFDK